MLLILHEVNDTYINTLCSYLDLNYIKYYTINQNQLFDLQILSVTNNSIRVLNNETELDLINDFKYIFYRRVNFFDETKIDRHGTIEKSFESEYHSMLKFIWEKVINKINVIWGNPLGLKLNRMSILELVGSNKILIPKYIATNNKNDLNKFLENTSSKLILPKPFSEGIDYIKNDEHYFYYTNVLNKNSIEKLIEDNFAISLFMEYINKDIDVRVFYFNEVFYTSAIINTDDEINKYDWRKSGNEIRVLPYKLPEKIEKKLLKIIKLLNINNCSIDMIRGIDKKYYFLEINIEGQFALYAYKCNYCIEESIVKKIKNYEQNQ